MFKTNMEQYDQRGERENIWHCGGYISIRRSKPKITSGMPIKSSELVLLAIYVGTITSNIEINEVSPEIDAVCRMTTVLFDLENNISIE